MPTSDASRSEQMEAARVWYLDSSVGLRIALEHSPSATRWYDEQTAAGAPVASSRILHLEMTRVLRRELLDVSRADDFVDELTLLRVDDDLIAEARAIEPHIKSLDALHLASAQRIGTAHTTVVTHDANMAAVAKSLGFEVHDPVTD